MQQAEIEIPFNVIKTELLDIYKQTWYTEINNSNRLSAYARFKHDFMCEKYLDFISDKKYRVADFVMVRTSKMNIMFCLSSLYIGILE